MDVDTYDRSLTVDFARGRASDRTKVLVVEDAVDAAVLAAETLRCACRAATGATALTAPERAARKAVAVRAFEAYDAVAAGGLFCVC